MRVAQINPDTYVDGMGNRASVYVQGCSIRCPGCQNPHMFERSGGREMTIGEIASELHAKAKSRKLTIIGGEPTEQAFEVSELILLLERMGWEHFVVYTGRTYESLCQDIVGVTTGTLSDAVVKSLSNIHYSPAELDERYRTGVWGILMMADVLVDGPYMKDQDDDRLQYRGSRNQRVIDLAAMRSAGDMLTIITRPDWDEPHVTITTDGRILGAKGLMIDLVQDDAKLETARRCGQGKYHETKD